MSKNSIDSIEDTKKVLVARKRNRRLNKILKSLVLIFTVVITLVGIVTISNITSNGISQIMLGIIWGMTCMIITLSSLRHINEFTIRRYHSISFRRKSDE